MRKIPAHILSLLAILLFLPELAYAQSFLVNIKNVRLGPEERVVGFDFKTTSGYASLIQAPPGWEIHVDNQPSENVEISGSVLVGAAALHWEKLNRMITITQVFDPGQTLQVTGEIIVTKDFEHTRTVTLPPESIDLVLKN